jgi:hypothetical protein
MNPSVPMAKAPRVSQMREVSESAPVARPQSGFSSWSTGYVLVMMLSFVMGNPGREKKRSSRKRWGS